MPPRRTTISIPGSDVMVQFTDDQSRTLILRESPVAYHSASGAATETRHVYLENSGVAARLATGRATSVLEIGLGTALGMLMTVDAAIDCGASLHYEAVEHRILSHAVFSSLELQQQLSHPGLADAFLDWRCGLGADVPSGRHCWRLDGDREIWLVAGDARRIDFDWGNRFDAIYFDPFAPAVNPELWTPRFLSKLRPALHDTGRLVTYCVSRQVRESFTRAGFDVQRVSGPPGGKREVLIATPSRKATE